jgi:hypothetical protein
MKPQPIEPETSLSVTMKAREWEGIIQVLQKAPYDQVAGAIQAIVGQCTSATERTNREAGTD